MMRVAVGARPFVWLLSVSIHAVLKLIQVDSSAGHFVTEEEIAASLVVAMDPGLIKAHEHQMVQNLFLLDDRIGSYAVPAMFVPETLTGMELLE